MNFKMKKLINVITFIWLLILIPLLLKHHKVNGIESTDSYFYLKIAEETLEGKFTDPVYSPGYPWLIAPLTTIISDVEIAGRIISLIFGALTLIVSGMFLIELQRIEIKKNGSENKIYVPIFATLFTAFNPKFIISSISTLPYTTATFFLWATLYLSVRKGKIEQNRRSNDIFTSTLAGIMCGAGYIVRPENILAIPMFILIARKIKDVILPLMVGFLIITTPYHIITLREGNLPSIITKFIRYKMPEMEKVAKEVIVKTKETDKETRGKFIKDVIKNLSDIKNYVKQFLSNIHLTHKYVIPNLITSSWLIILGMGIPAFIRRTKIYIASIISIIVIWLLPLFPLITLADYMLLPILPALGAVAGHFHLSFEKNTEREPENPYIKKLPHVFIISAVALNLFYSMRPFYKDEGRRIYKIAGQWIRENLGEEQKIFEPSPFATFYAKGIWYIRPDNANILVESSFDFISGRAIPELIILPPEKIEYAKMLTEIRYKGKMIRIFKNTRAD